MTISDSCLCPDPTRPADPAYAQFDRADRMLQVLATYAQAVPAEARDQWSASLYVTATSPLASRPGEDVLLDWAVFVLESPTGDPTVLDASDDVGTLVALTGLAISHAAFTVACPLHRGVLARALASIALYYLEPDLPTHAHYVLVSDYIDAWLPR